MHHNASKHLNYVGTLKHNNHMSPRTTGKKALSWQGMNQMQSAQKKPNAEYMTIQEQNIVPIPLLKPPNPKFPKPSRKEHQEI